MFISAGIAIMILAVAYVKLRQKRKKAGIKGWVRSQDLDGRGKKLYRDTRTGITAKPDIVLNDRVIEYKSAHAGNKARRSDILQLTAEMIAAEKEIGELRYGNKKNFEFRINSPKMRSIRSNVERISRLMEQHLRNRTPPKATPTRNKCAKCDYRRECSKSIAA